MSFILIQGHHRTTSILKGIASQHKKSSGYNTIPQDLSTLLGREAHFSRIRQRGLSKTVRSVGERRPNASELITGVEFTVLSSGRVLYSSILKKHRNLVLEELNRRNIPFDNAENITTLKSYLKTDKDDAKSFKPLVRECKDWDIEDERAR